MLSNKFNIILSLPSDCTQVVHQELRKIVIRTQIIHMHEIVCIFQWQTAILKDTSTKRNIKLI